MPIYDLTPKPPPPPHWYIGLDFGQAHDHTALAIVDRDRPPPSIYQPATDPATYAVVHLRRWPLGTTYPAIVADVVALVRELAGRMPPPVLRLVADATGVGRPVLDLLRGAGLPFRATGVTITGGDAATCDEAGDWRVPKRDLVAGIAVLLQADRLKIAAALPDAATLTGELLAFRVTLSPNGHDTYGNGRENPHDDLVLATATACWYAEQDRAPGVPYRPGTWGYRR